MSKHLERFDVLIVGESTPDKTAKPAWIRGHSHWNCRVLKVPQGGSVPLEAGKDYAFSKELFNYGSFLGDSVEIEWDGQKYDRAETFLHGYVPADMASTVDGALEALRKLKGEVSGAIRLPEVAGRSIYAAYLLDLVYGQTSWRKDYPENPGNHSQKVEAVQLAAAIFSSITLAQMKAVSKEGSSLSWGAERIIAASKEKIGQLMYESTLALQCGLMCFMPRRRASAAEVESIGRMFAMAAEAEKNYGRDTGNRVLERLLGPEQK